MLEIMIDFVEENWSAFVFRCKESGMTNQEAEEKIDKMKAEAGIC